MRCRTYRVCGVPIAAMAPRAAAQAVVDAASMGRPVEVHLCNAYTLSLVDDDAELRAALQRADFNFPDGTPVAWLGRKYGVEGPVRGPGLMRDVVDLGRSRKLRHYYLGAGPGVADKLAEQFEIAFPGAVTAGVESPPFSELDDTYLDEVAQRIEESESSIVWVGIGTPRQDYLVPRLSARLSIPVVPVGAAFDFWSGAVEQPPRWLHGTGLEWLHRLMSEPRRLWRRYLIGNPRFVLSAIRHRLRGQP